ncbi:hypothetical protein E2542_SST28623 [Spatholobus suberectus]|nr:hypothetical protein E2542_SST28623 [Spatholobus suberectus]
MLLTLCFPTSCSQVPCSRILLQLLILPSTAKCWDSFIADVVCIICGCSVLGFALLLQFVTVVVLLQISALKLVLDVLNDVVYVRGLLGPEIAHLSHLQMLDLTLNYFVGKLPPES